MKSLFLSVMVFAACIFVGGCFEQQGGKGGLTSLETGFWEFYGEDSEADAPDVWRVEDGVLVCKGLPRGYLYSKEQFEDFVLKLEWRWPEGEEPGNGGVLIRMVGEHKIWPKSLEAQLNAGGAGDFWGLDGYELDGPENRTNSVDHERFGRLTNIKRAKDMEKPAGQWNSYEIISEGEVVTLVINGEQVNRATGCKPVRGRICLTAEGDEIHFRNIKLMPVGE